MPHLGHVSGPVPVTSGCMGQAYVAGAGARTAWSCIPQAGTGPRFGGGDVGVHRAGVERRRLDLSAVEQGHESGEAEDLVGLPVEVGAHGLVLGGELGVGAQHVVGGGGIAGGGARHPERAEEVGMAGRPVLKADIARRVEEDVDDGPLRGCEKDLLHQGLPLVAAAVAADQLHAGAWQGHVKDAGVGRVD
jgi:hypothetical protein